jgi:hypothetical protein
MLLWGSSLQFERDHVNLVSGYAPFRKRYEVAYTDVLGVEAAKEHSAGEQDHFCLGIKFRIPIPDDEIEKLSDLSPEEKKEEIEFLRNVKYAKKVTVIKRLERRKHAEAVANWLQEKLRLSSAP